MRAAPPEPTTTPTEPSCLTALIIRPASPADLGDFLDLADLAGPGFTSLPADEFLLAKSLAQAVAAFKGGKGALILSLFDRRAKKVVGCAAVKPGGHPRPGFLNFSLSDDRKRLLPTTRYSDLTEIGSLFLHPAYRQGGIGRWLAQSRYLLVASDPERFSERLFAELRGIVGLDRRSPFYDAVGLSIFQRSYEEADHLIGSGRGQVLIDLLPKHPFRLDDLAPSACDAIGRPHEEGQRAFDMLLDEGFCHEGVVDLLDAGPLVVASRHAIRTVRNNFCTIALAGGADPQQARLAFLLAGEGMKLRCCRALVEERMGALLVDPASLDAMEIRSGSRIRGCFAAPAITGVLPIEHRSLPLEPGPLEAGLWSSPE